MQVTRFFLVCAGLFLLVLSYNLGVGAAHGQVSTMEAATIESDWAFAVVGRSLWRMNSAGVVDMIPEPVPGTSRAVACWSDGVLLENGEAWRYRGGWVHFGTFALGATHRGESSWGSLKARYR